MALLIVPGLGDSGHDHWQSWLQRRASRAWRVAQHDWREPALARWTEAAARACRQPRAWRGCYHEPVIAVAHGFGCLALADLLGRGEATIDAALLVAPLAPRHASLAPDVVDRPLGRPAIVVTSVDDPWTRPDEALRLADRWGAGLVNVGTGGHLNVASGHGPWPLAQRLVTALSQRVAAARRWQAEDVAIARCEFAV